MQLSDPMKAVTRDLLQFLNEHGVPHKIIRDGKRHGTWFPMGKLLRVCGYRSPAREAGKEPLDHVETAKMLIGGKLQVTVEMAEFARLIGAFCEASLAQQFATQFLNDFVIRPYKSAFIDEQAQGDLSMAAELLETQEELAESLGDPGLVNMLKRPDSHFIVHEGKVRLARPAPDPDEVGFQGLLDCFLEGNPQWAHDVRMDVKLPDERVEKCLTTQALLAFSKWFVSTYPWKATDETEALQMRLEQQIEDDGQDFGPRGSPGNE